MAEKKTTPIVIDDKEYMFEDMTEQQQTLVNHVADLDRKIRSAQFNLDQLVVGRDAFMAALRERLQLAEESKVEE
jgi:hypothetical protein